MHTVYHTNQSSIERSIVNLHLAKCESVGESRWGRWWGRAQQRGKNYWCEAKIRDRNPQNPQWDANNFSRSRAHHLITFSDDLLFGETGE